MQPVKRLAQNDFILQAATQFLSCKKALQYQTPLGLVVPVGSLTLTQLTASLFP